MRLYPPRSKQRLQFLNPVLSRLKMSRVGFEISSIFVESLASAHVEEGYCTLDIWALWLCIQDSPKA
jgi:hypothetical protein